jgi:hypothetical protein
MRSCRNGALIGLFAVAVSVAPVAAAEPPPGNDVVDTYPLGQGHYTTAADPGWIYFKTPGKSGYSDSCGISPNGDTVGCDEVPYDAPTDTNQTVVNSWEPAAYRHSDTPTFTRDVDVLPEGRRLVNGGTSCATGYQGTVHCKTNGGEHGFIVSGVYGILW